MKKKIFPLPPGVWFVIICAGIVVFFILLKPAERMDLKRDPRQTIQEAEKKSKEKKEIASSVIQDEPIAKSCIAQVEFYGDALAQNKYDGGMIILEGEGTSRWAYALIQFAKPVDFFTSTITFLAKGGGQAQAMEVGFTDIDRRTTAQDERISLALGEEYQKMSIRGTDIQSISFNKGKVSALKIGWEKSPEASTDEQVSLFIKDLSLVSNEEYLDAEEKTTKHESLLE